VQPGTAVLATPGSLEQVLDNLISNAARAMPGGGRVTLTAAGAGGVVELHVRDTGPGMTADQRARALDRFWRASSAGTGTGLGLAIVNRLVAADGGTVELREAEGGGLDVVVRLPASGETSGAPRPGTKAVVTP
jgi:signal transduction histidine kinase